MRKSFIKQMLAVLKSRAPSRSIDIHGQLAETIAERQKILDQWEKIFQPRSVEITKDIHDQLRETIAGLKQTKQQFRSRLFSTKDDSPAFRNKKAA